MAITIIDLPQSTQYALLKDKTGRKQRITDYINSIDTKWPAKILIRNRKEQFWKDNKDEYDALKGISPDNNFTQFFNKFNGEQDLIDQIKPQHIKQIDELLKEQPADDELIKELKATARNKAQDISDYYDNADGGITWGDFVVDLISNYYLKKAPEYINTKLNENGVKLSELDKTEWEKAKENLFNNIYSTFTDDKKESDLDPLLKGLNDANNNISDLIIKAKKATPDPAPATDNSEEIKKLNEQIKTLTANQEKHKPEDLEKHTEADLKPKDLPNDWEQQLRQKTTLEGETQKLKDDNKNLLDAGKLAAQKIKKIEGENTALKTENAALKAGGTTPTPTPPPSPTPGGGGTAPLIKGSDEWKAVVEFLTELDIVERKNLLKKLDKTEWTSRQKSNIYKYLKAAEENQEWIIGRIKPTRFSA